MPCCCTDNTWAKTVLDASSDCTRLTYGSTQLNLNYPAGTSVSVAKADITPIDCGFLDVGSLVISTTNIGATATIVSQTLTDYVLMVTVQAKSLTAEQQAALQALEPASTSDSLGQLKAKYDSLLTFIKTIWLGAT